MKNKKLKLFFLSLIFIVAFVLRFYKLGEIPAGLNRDETAIGYNAYSIITTGKDEYGKNLPLYFQSFGDYKLPVYVYTTVLSVKAFGLNAFAVRFPSALFGFLTIIVFYFLIKELTKKEGISLLSTFILSLAPWSIFYNRATFEVSMSLFFYLLGTLLIILSLRRKINSFFLLGTVLFLVSLYSYNLTRLLSPVLYFGTLFLFKDEVKKVSKLELISTFVLTIISLIPFIVTFAKDGGVSSASGTLLSSSAIVKAPLIEFRSYLIDAIPSGLTTLLFNNPIQLFWQYLQNVASYLSVSFFFITGSSHGNHGIGNVGQFYLFELPLFILGITILLKQEKFIKNLMLLWIISTVLIAAFTRDVPHATRSYFLLFPMVYIIALGLENLIVYASKIKKSYFKLSLYAVLLIIFSYNLVYYFSSYFFRFPIAYAKQWNEEDKNLSEYLKQNMGNYNQIIFDNNSKFPYTSYLFYNKYLPEKFHFEQQRYAADTEGFTLVKSFDKFYFRDVDWMKEKQQSLIITTQENVPKGYPVLKTFYFPTRPVVEAIGQKIYQYPISDVAYVLVEIK